LRKIIQEERVDIVHAQSRMPAWVAYFACKATPATFISSCHGYYSQHFFSKVMGYAKKVIVISRIIGRHMVDNLGVDPQKIHLVYRGVDLSIYNYDSHKYDQIKDTLKIVNIARITPIKGQEDFIKAISIVVKQRPNIQAWIVGGVDKAKERYATKLHNLINKLGLKDKVKFLGERKDINSILSQSDILVLSTRVPEAFGRVIIEAGAVGVAVCAPQTGGIAEIIEHKKDGLLFSYADQNSMAQAITNLIDEPNLMREYSINLRRKVEEKFSLLRMARETRDVYQKALVDKKILVIKLGGLGDLILATASLRALREKFPAAKISLLIDKHLSPIIKNCPYIDELILYERKKRKISQLISGLKKKDFDISIDFKNSNFTHLIAYLSNIPCRYGFSKGLDGFLLNNPLRLSPNLNEEPVKQQFRILEKLGISNFNDGLELWTESKEDIFIEKVLQEKGVSRGDQIIGLSIGASPQWPTKNWPLENFVNLSQQLILRGFKVALLGGDCLKEKAGAFPEDKNIINFMGETTLRELVSLIKRLAVLVTPDSAPLHIASAVNTKIVALFGPTDPQRHSPPADKIKVLVKHIDCQPCYKRRCPHKDKMACLKQISVEEVLEEIIEMTKPE
jgi:lipopolysaccharide heptosyltransferase II